MKFAFCNEMLGSMSQADGLRLAADFGYTGVEIAPFTLGPNAAQITQKQRSEYREIAASSGIQIIGLHWLLAKTEGYHLTTDDSAVRIRTAEYLIELARLCRDLGGDIMVLGSPQQRNFLPPQTHDIATRNAIAVLERTLPTLEQLFVRIAIEPLGPGEGNFLNHASQAVEMIRTLDSPFVKLHLDVKAMSSEGIPIESIIRDNRQDLIHFHANDPNLLGPGMGDVDQQPIFDALIEIGYEGWVSVEAFDYSPGIERLLRESMANMQGLMRDR